MKLQLKNVRLAFPQLFEPTTVAGEGKPSHSAAFLFPKNHPCIKEVKAAIDKVGADKWGAKWAGVKKAMEAADKTALHDGNTKADYAGYEDQLFINARNVQRPTVLDADKTPLTAADGRPYAGCYVNAIVEFWAQDNQYGKRVNASLMGVQFYRDGDAFAGGGVADADDFDSIDEGADAEAVLA